MDLIGEIPKSLEPKTQLKINESNDKFYTLRLAKVDVNSSSKTVKIGLIITYYWRTPDSFSSKIINIFPKFLSGAIQNGSQNNDIFQPLIPSLSKNINLTFMTSPIIKKEDPYWG
ncbi:hypothetical protein, partial [Mycoplasma sp. 'Moose RK']|uniref:hypothetical protein n=1 Tax=Mycoplasma sp. 'Moose RK' TaxID=2780095 RepID=UPI0018C22864